MTPLSYILVPSTFGALALLWRDTDGEPKVWRVLLPRNEMPIEEMLRTQHADAHQLSCPAMASLGQQMTNFLEGEDKVLPLDNLALETCSKFQRRVLRAEHGIPRGWVSAYGRIASHLGVPGGGRAVGSALANNPFLILIPCHRAIRADGKLGGFQGGPEMKRALLELEGVEVSPAGKVLTDRIFYSQMGMDNA